MKPYYKKTLLFLKEDIPNCNLNNINIAWILSTLCH